MNEVASKARKSRALPYLLIGALMVLAASLTPSSGHHRPALDASGQPILRDGFNYPIYERDTAAELCANWPSYLCGLVGVGFIVRAAVIRLRFGTFQSR